MTSTSKPDPMEVIMDAYLAELLEMTDEQVLEGQDPADIQKEGLRLLGTAKAEVGRRRLAAARQELDAKRSAPAAVSQAHVTAQEARAFLRQTANDGLYTLAARGLDEVSDEEAIRMYQQIKQLEQQRKGEPPGETG